MQINHSEISMIYSKLADHLRSFSNQLIEIEVIQSQNITEINYKFNVYIRKKFAR